MSKLRDDVFGPEWYNFLGGDNHFQSTGFQSISKKLGAISKAKTVYPNPKVVFRAFQECPLDKLKVVMLGQDPYPDGSATGLAFGNELSTDLSPSLEIIRDELEENYQRLELDFDTTLEPWASQGVLLLNSALTVEKGRPGSHQELWRPFIQTVLSKIVRGKSGEGIIFVMMGAVAQSFITSEMSSFHDVIMVSHPVRDKYTNSRYFRGSGVFTKINNSLHLLGKSEIKFIKNVATSSSHKEDIKESQSS